MITLTPRQLFLACALCIAAGWWLSSSPSSPVNPTPPANDRPVLRFIAKAAKNFLWIALLAEPAPKPERQMVQTQIGDDGHPIIDHGRSL